MEQTMALYVLFDKVAEEFGPLFEQKNHGSAIRSTRAVAKKNGFRRGDYLLFQVGEVRREGKRATVDGLTEMEQVYWEEGEDNE